MTIRYLRWIVSALCICAMIGMLGCEDDDDDPPSTSHANVEGTWIGIDATGAPFTMTLNQDVTDLSGRVTSSDGSFRVTGFVAGNNIVLNIPGSDVNTISGTVNGNTMTLTYGAINIILNR